MQPHGQIHSMDGKFIQMGQRLLCEETKLQQTPSLGLFWDSWYPVLVLLQGGGFFCKALGACAMVLLSCAAGLVAPGTLP